MHEESETRFGPRAIDFLKEKFLTGPEIQEETKKQKELEEEPAEKVTKTDIERAVKKDSWSTIRTTGEVQIGDIVGIGPRKREELADSGFWSTSDVYKAWKDGNIEEIVLAFKGVRDKRDVIASTILLAPEASTRLTKQDILDTIPKKLPVRGTTFLERREKEIREYLKKLKIDGIVPVKVTIQDEGERLTQEKAEELIEPSKATPPVPVILTESKIIRGIAAQKRKVKDRIFEQGIRNAMTGVEKGKIQSATAFKKFFDTLEERNPRFQTDKKAFKKAKDAFVNGTIDVFKKEGVFIEDPDLKVLRASNVELARTILSGKKMQVQIGQTNNFQIPTLKDDAGNPITFFLTTGKINDARPGQLVFQSVRSNSIEPIRFTGHMSIESEKDIDNLVKVLGTNPKNGFAPKGYEHVDDAVKQLMNTFSVIVTYPPVLSINTPRITSVKKLKDKYIIRTDTNDEIWTDADVHVWIAENGETKELQGIARKETLDEIARESFNKPYDQLTEAEIASLAIDPDLLPDIWGFQHEYGGSLCHQDPASSTLYRRLEALKNDIRSLTSIEKKNPRGIEKEPVTIVNPQKREVIENFKDGSRAIADEFVSKVTGSVAMLTKSMNDLVDELGINDEEKTIATKTLAMKTDEIVDSVIDVRKDVSLTPGYQKRLMDGLIDELHAILNEDMILQDAVDQKKDEMIAAIDKKLVQILEEARKITGSINPYSMPNCVLIPKPAKNKIMMKMGSGSTYVETKLDKAIAKCSVLPPGEKERCFVDTVKITQNLTNDVLGSRIYSAIRSAKNVEERLQEKEDVKFLSSIEHVIRTGRFKEEFIDDKLQEIKPTRSQKRQSLNRAKLLGKMPLDTARWSFLSKLG